MAGLPQDMLGRFLVDGERFNAEVGSSIIDFELLRSMEGASTLTMTISDPNSLILESGALVRAKRTKPRKGFREVSQDRLGRTRLVYGHTGGVPNAFRLAGISKQGTRLVLRWEDEIVSVLRQHTKPKSAVRGSLNGFMTRALFIKQMALEPYRELPGNIYTYIPGMFKHQPVEKPRNAETGVTRSSFKWMDGTKPTKDQVRNINLVLEQSEKDSAGERATLALIEACIVEPIPPFANPTFGHSSSVGILQLLNTHLGGSTSTRGGRRDVSLVTHMFLTRGFAGQGGAISLARKHPSWLPGQIAQAVQGSAYPERYEEHREEAHDILAAFGGASGGAVEFHEKVLFRRGNLDYQPADGARENSWQAMTRLAGEVDKRVYTANNIFYYVADTDLIRFRPLMTIAEQPPETGSEHGVFYVGELNFDWDPGKPVNEVTIPSVPAEAWLAYPGAVCEVRRAGPATGRWLTWSIRETGATASAEIVLRRPEVPKAEPRANLKTVQTTAAGGARERILEIAEKSLTKHTGYNRYSQAGGLTGNPIAPLPYRTDCSQWTRAVYIKAGLPDIGVNTWEQVRKGTRTGRPRPGDLMFTKDQGHVELYVGGDKTYGHGSPPIDEGSVAYFRQSRGVFFVTFDFLNDDA
jgi:hypothetical protein